MADDYDFLFRYKGKNQFLWNGKVAVSTNLPQSEF